MSFSVSPGVYGRETDRSHVVPSASNSVGAIVISAKRGPTGQRVTVTSNQEFLELFGKPTSDNPSMYSALAFLEEANQLHVVRASAGGTEADVVIREDIEDPTSETSLTFRAVGEGSWGNEITVIGSRPSGLNFVLTVFEKGVELEQFEVSLNPEEKDGFGRNLFIEEVVNNGSRYIRVEYNAGTNPYSLEFEAAFSGGSDASVAPSSGEIMSSWDLFTSKDEVEVHLLINGGWTAPAVQVKMISVAESRADAFAILDVPSTENTVVGMTDYVRNELNQNSTYAAIYGGWPMIYDQFNDRTLYVPPSGLVAGVYARTARVAEVWNAPAGARRGNLRVIGVSKVFTEGERDLLYSNNINPIQSFVGEGVQVYGQKTLTSTASALDRVNVRLLMNSLQVSMNRALRPFVFEFNDSFTRANISSMLNNFLEDVKVRKGVYDYLVTCDESNNTPVVVDNNQLIVDVFVKPVRVAEFIRLNVVITATGAEFTAG